MFIADEPVTDSQAMPSSHSQQIAQRRLPWRKVLQKERTSHRLVQERRSSSGTCRSTQRQRISRNLWATYQTSCLHACRRSQIQRVPQSSKSQNECRDIGTSFSQRWSVPVIISENSHATHITYPRVCRSVALQIYPFQSLRPCERSRLNLCYREI